MNIVEKWVTRFRIKAMISRRKKLVVAMVVVIMGTLLLWLQRSIWIFDVPPAFVPIGVVVSWLLSGFLLFGGKQQTVETGNPLEHSKSSIFRVFPKTRHDWVRALFLPFQAYVVVAILVEQYFVIIWPRHWHSVRLLGYERLAYFQERVKDGYAICCIVLFVTGIVQLTKGHARSGCLNLGLAVLGGLLDNSIKFYVVT